MNRITKIVLLAMLMFSGLFVLKATAAVTAVNSGDQIRVDIKTNSVSNLAGVQLNLSFNQNVLRYDRTTEGDFLKQGGASTIFLNTINTATPGLLKNIAVARIGGGANGSGTLVSVYFTAIGNGSPNLQLANVLLADPSGNSLPSSVVILNTTVIFSVPPSTLSISTPTISGITASSAIVSFSSNQAGNSRVIYCLSSNECEKSSPTDADLTLNHSISLNNLLSCVTYHVKALSQFSSLSGESERVSFTTLGCPGGSRVNEKTTARILSGAGGSVNLSRANHSIKLDISSGFDSKDADFQIHELDKDEFFSSIPQVSGKLRVAGPVYELKAIADNAISSFSKPITITMTYDQISLPSGIDPATLKIYRHDGFSWSPLENCNTSGNTITCTTTQFSSFAIFGDPSALSSSSTPPLPSSGGGGGGGGGGFISPAVTQTSSGCSSGNLFNTLTGQLCSTSVTGSSTSLIVGCGGGNLFSMVTGQSCTAGAGSSSVVSSSSYNFGSVTIRLGSRGEACKSWQRFFNDRISANLKVDGVCGRLTIATARKWQAMEGLTADGLLGTKSRIKATTGSR
ncbi:hypothetical protein A3D42_03060 [Candidatus Nomurabacteria bacterium RIFCSPHIGHO2_02_FULL_41_18]|uniref:Cohesin domain-containing protein n=1 Tax=Candidatus Nomurabacteria bacterium RIFCSPHIGHO2_02_FULL_41_18 TaxID=1801754 RepID=A0A1F6W5S2_9BACT|nr:MAG: hypothetical protein A2737_02110 [Candidatus Nomurabacteria bacterium RIFCSPHIGHO2_01_FULL_41_71]OGI77278.1 MAG: hypothetical protein A3D42_03060 [Candidatus Nomurabacteria bacterium RIFCSPHIGHO2_02_FULL_41_18]OGI89422.1 MAG: hypothetical protein A3B01_01410 [Candidatus Nomurabacteria bacterium RIFCSPLOWO2_01_FULL_41_52b]